jgi:hypothetical protein
MRGSDYCWFHNPSIAQERTEARKRGAQQTRLRRRKIVLPHDTADLPLTNAEEVAAALARTFNDVRRGEMDVRTANCLALIGGTILRAIAGEREIAVTVRPASPSPPLITEEVRRRILEQVRQRHGLPPLPLVGMKELPALSPAAGTNGATADHARLSPPG